ncbi:MAG: hypothetical protein A3A97_01030 [Candidatus Terrybacteria bacterium RIFCSPLOWO2_01_FULL_40_23]|uniref:Uncharacterized protein n=1 Tax=Candidatus Terrybacteria bacterium RIFCSPLOWO2_01_FULL_40_23 TaxID=1802366 RepID=A0A1G2PY60_9BACT|nr:MAG: hypothetical protein A3A97_01030 [Candidatus Terrybacteria bacterium RIFCSPLOWO2_01_FULL_40_23]
MVTRKKVKNKRINSNKPVSIDWLEKRFARLDKRVENLVDSRVNQLEKNVEHLVDSRIEQLALMTQQGFQHGEDRFDKIDERLEQHEIVLANIAHVLENIELRLSQTAYKVDLDILADRFERIEKRMSR